MNKIARLAVTPVAAALREALDARLDRLTEDTVAVQQIAAPTFDEARRAAFVHARFHQIPGLDSIETDALSNVYARLPGSDHSRPALLLSAHLDTVFDAETSLDVVRNTEEKVICGPGIGDNSLGVAMLLMAAEVLSAHQFPADIWFVANTREEGMGDLGGIRAVRDRLGPKLGDAIVIEGMALGRIYHAGIAVRRLRISCTGPGGHSWLHFGRPSAIHGLMRLGAQIAALRPPETPRTTYNIGVIEGGSTVNSIASDASLLLDLRSETVDALATLEKTVLNLVSSARTPELSFNIEIVGDRPAGSIPRHHPLVQTAYEVLDYLGVRPIYETGSTDANALLAVGLPTVTIGITHGGNSHRTDEYIELPPMRTGALQVLLLAQAVASGMATPG